MVHFFALWPFSGAFMQVAGAGLLQARFFYLLVGWLALPFLYLSARKRYSQVAALATVALASFIPLHYNWAVAYIQVPRRHQHRADGLHFRARTAPAPAAAAALSLRLLRRGRG